MADLDFEKIGLLVGLEIHQQLNSEKKLFCDCQAELFNEEPDFVFTRRLRPTQSELGQIDAAALFEFKKGIKILYEGTRPTSCLVEMDEEPPHDIDRESLEAALVVSLMLKANPVNEIHVMRKTVIDGSNTTGFQRTAVVALGGEVRMRRFTSPIQHISLEEDAARKISQKDSVLTYRLDRLCIPLVEVATAPLSCTPEEAEEVALRIGQILRASGTAKRGLGTIRQDLNVSIREGNLVEIKGVQKLELVSSVIETEVQRQLSLLEIREELTHRGVEEEDLQDKPQDITRLLADTKCNIIRAALQEKKRVFALKLSGFGGIFGRKLTQSTSFGREVADRVRFWGAVGGILHTDELLAYGITAEEAKALNVALNIEKDDAIVLVAEDLEKCCEALEAVRERAVEALTGVPEETRAALDDGSTRYMRPRPGAARMYPETDVPPIQISQSFLEELRLKIPEPPEKKMGRLLHAYGLNRKLAGQVLNSRFNELFEEIVKETKVSATVVAAFLTETFRALERDGVDVDGVSPQQIMELFKLISAGRMAKEAASDVLVWLTEHPEGQVEEAVETLKLGMLPEREIEVLVDRLIGENRRFLNQRKEDAFGRLMGLVMKQERGRVKADIVRKIVAKKMDQI
ncbi:Glu-tRNA(Gln) amidotransferase subunit GatE [Candidatus Bathyarchaeota archaeon]|nr:Glu-tRNA(Gln) amidotransferase subunit GatE [Candidatus Bathyarchaeota archaeon]